MIRVVSIVEIKRGGKIEGRKEGKEKIRENLPSMSSKIESNRQSGLALLQVSTIELVGFFCSAESCILSDCPWLISVHCGISISCSIHYKNPRMYVTRIRSSSIWEFAWKFIK